MHILSTTEKIVLGTTLGAIEPGEYLVEDVNAFELGIMGSRGAVKVRPYEGPSVAEATNYLLVRCGAIGDLLFLSPAIRAFQAKHPSAKITLACFEKHWPVCRDFGVELTSYPVPLEIAQSYHVVIPLENCMELNPGVHATDAFAKKLGVEVEEYIPSYDTDTDEVDRAWLRYPKGDKPRVGLQMKSSRVTRDYPMPLWERVIQTLLERGWQVFLFGAPGQIAPIKPCPKEVINLSQDHLSFNESAAVLKTMDVFCGVDSALLPLCHALGVKAIGLYGPFPWEARTAKAPLTRAISGHGPCAPCNWHTHAGRHFPPNCPSAKLGFCGVLADIDPLRIAVQIDKHRT